MKKMHKTNLVSSIALIAASGFWLSGASAQQSLGGLMVEEITVTAQKREESMRDVPIAVTAFSGNQIKKLGFNQSSEIIAQVPGLTVSTVSGSLVVALFNIRGVNQNDFADHHESPIAVYEDEAYIASMTASAIPLFDIARVEVLKGPQGTLFGRNATGGLIHFITEKPSTDEVNGYGRFSYGRFDQIELEGAANVPLGDKAAVRLSGIMQKSDGYYRDLSGPNTHEQDVRAFRGQVLLEPNEDLEIIVKAHYLKNDNERTGAYSEVPSYPGGQNGYGIPVGADENPWGTCNGCDVYGYSNPSDDPLYNDYDFKGFFDREVAGGTATVKWDFDNFSMVSLTDYRHSKKDYAEDTDSTPNPLMNFATSAEVDMFSQEIRFSGEVGDLNWVAGGSYLKIDGEYGSKIWDNSSYTGITSLDGLSFDSYGLWDHDKTAWAVFGQVDYAISEQLSAIVGGRYTRDKVTHSWSNVVGLDPFGYFALPGAVSQFAATSKDDLFDFKTVLEYRPDEEWLIYAGVSQGSKGAGFNGSFQPDYAASIPFKREKLLNYEAGAKTSLFQNRAFLNLAAFYYDYTDYQAFVFEGLAQRVQNVDATVIGTEIELQANPVEGLDLNFGASFLFKSKAKDVLLPDGSMADQALPITPDFTLNGLVRYSWNVPVGVASVQVDASYQDDVYYSIVNHPTTKAKSFTLVNARVSLAEVDDTWEVAGFVSNIFDKRYQTFALDVSSFSFTQTQWGRPRWWGVEMTYNF